MTDDEQSRIHKLEQQLYSRDYTPEEDERTEITSNEVEGVPTDWQSEDKKEGQKPKKKILQQKEGFFVKWFLIVSILFFLVSFAIAAFVFLQGGVDVSARNVDVRILGPVSIGGGEELSLEVIVDNKNNVDMEAATVFVEYPEGTRSAENINNELLRDNQDYGPIGAGRNVRKTFKSVLFGEQDDLKEVTVVVEYRMRGSSATFEKEKKYEIQISSSPVLVNVEYPTEVSSNQEIEFTIDVVSNSSTPLNNVVLRAEYPFGFMFSGANPEPTYDNDIFSIGTIEPEEEVTLTIRGMLQAQNNEERTFRFNVGTQSDTDERELGAVYVASRETVRVAQSNFGLSARVNNSQSEQVAVRSGQDVNGVISWINNFTNQIVDADLSVSFSGEMLNESAVRANNGGFYRSSEGVISWDQNAVSDLGEIPPGDQGSVGFRFGIDSLTSYLASSVRNPEIALLFTITGTQFSDGSVPREVRAQTEKTVRVASDFDLEARAVRTIGPIENSGPTPLRVDETTTYTVIWSINNSYNDVRGARVVAQLPPYVEWEDIYSPSTENISFDEVANQIVWEIDRVPAGAGFSTPAKEVAFRLAVTPGLSQVGTTPVILRQTSASGQDDFAGIQLSDTDSSLSTELPDDPNVGSDEGTVVQ